VKKVLFVDDEPNVLQGLRRMLRPMRSEWDMHFAEGPEQATDLLQSHAFDVIVTDMRMPHMDGAELLAKVMKSDPTIARIVLSGQTDQEAALRSAGTVHQFLAKPCDADALKGAVQRACQLRELLSDHDLVSIAAGLGKLPSVPDVYTELTRELNSDDASIKRIGDIVGRDLAMTAKILQLVNSAFFGLPRTVENAEEAVSFLGADVIRGLVLSKSAFEAFNTKCEGFSIENLWQHSLIVGSLSHDLAKAESATKATIDESLIAGMLHDIGQLILATGVPDEYRQARALARENNISLREAEISVLGCGHGEIGAYLMGLWGLPDGIVEAIAYHHNPETCPTNVVTPLVAVHAANALIHKCLDGDDSPESVLHEQTIQAVNCGTNVDSWMQLTREKLECKDAA